MAPRSEERTAKCPETLTRVFSLLGKRWTGQIIAVLLERPARFAELARAIPGITEGMLSTRLRELKETGLVVREVRDGPPISSMYRLTERGQGLRSGLLALERWAAVNLPRRPRTRAAKP
jgi:DNA-binding HxlR family transcriptional regulator